MPKTRDVLLTMYHPCGCLSAALWVGGETKPKEVGAFYQTAFERGCEVRKGESVRIPHECGKPDSECDMKKFRAALGAKAKGGAK